MCEKQLRYGEDVESGIDLMNLFLGGAGGFFFDDGLDFGAAGVFPKHAAVAGGVVEVGAEQGHRGLLVEMEVEQLGDGLGRDLRSVAGENDDMVVGGECWLRDHQSVAGAALLGLQNEIDAGVGDGGADAVGLVTDDGEDIAGRNHARGGGDDVRQQRLAADFMQNFRKLRLEPRAFPGGHDGDGDVGDDWRGVLGEDAFLDFFIRPTIPWPLEPAKEYRR